MAKRDDVTIYDLAARAGVSASTVSRALKGHPAISEQTRQKILTLAVSMGYQPNVFAVNIRKKKTYTAGILIPRITSEFMAKAVTEIQRILNAGGYNLIISQSDESYETEVKNALTLFNSRVDGLLVSLSNETTDCYHFQPFLQKAIPVVMFDRVLPGTNAVTVTVDNFQGGFLATEHLIKQGRKKIVFLSGPLQCDVYRRRYEGFVEVMKKHGLAVSAGSVVECQLSHEDGQKIIRDFLKKKSLPEGIVCCNDLSAAGCITELNKNNVKIPSEIAVVGFNNDTVAGIVNPALTTIHIPVDRMARQAALILLQLMEGNKIPSSRHISFPCHLVIRNSA